MPATTTTLLLAALRETFPQHAAQITPRPTADHPALNIPPSAVLPILTHLRDAHGYEVLADLTAIDSSPAASPRYTVIWHLLSMTHTPGAYLRIAADCASDTAPEIPSVTSLWSGADWHERETYDLMGITFQNHPDPRRILLWDGYPHHPLRKDFPLAGLEADLPDPEVSAETNVKVHPAPMTGGPFVATNGEPRAKDESWAEEKIKN